jgi:hypothetical protein
MPRRIVIAYMAFGASALLMVAFGLVEIFHHDETLLTDLAGILGVAEFVTLGRLLERRPVARVIAMSLCLVQTLLGVIGLVAGVAIALPMIALAAFVVVPLSTQEADEYFGAPA